MDCNELKKGLMGYEIQCKTLGIELLSLSDKCIKESLRPIGKIIPTPMFTMWCKKCWPFIDSAILLSNQNNGPKQENTQNMHKSTLTNFNKQDDIKHYEEYACLSLLPHEYLSLICNARDRQEVIKACDRPTIKHAKKKI